MQCFIFDVQVQAILDTWGKRCDGYVASSNLTDPAVSAFNFPRRGPENFHNIWQKVRATLMAIEVVTRRREGAGGDSIAAEGESERWDTERLKWVARRRGSSHSHGARSNNRSDTSSSGDTSCKRCNDGSHARSTVRSEEFDWVFVSGDDTYVLVDSLRAFLASETVRAAEAEDRRRPVFMGQV